MSNFDSFHYKVTNDENKNCNIDNENYTRLDRKQGVVLSQLRCGISPMTMNHLYKVNIEESSICKECGDKNDSIEHVTILRDVYRTSIPYLWCDKYITGHTNKTTR